MDEIFQTVRGELLQFQREQGLKLFDCKAGHDVAFTAVVPYVKGDMPEMCKVCGHVGVNGDELCRCCHVKKADAGDGAFDVLANQRDQGEMDAVRKTMSDMKSKADIEKLRKQTGSRPLLLVMVF